MRRYYQIFVLLSSIFVYKARYTVIRREHEFPGTAKNPVGIPPGFRRVCSQSFKEGNRLLKIVIVGVTLCDAADQLEGAEGIEAEAAVLAQDLRIVPGHSLVDGLGIALLFRTVSIQEEDLFPFGQVLLRKFQHGLVEFGIVNAGCEAHRIVAGQVCRLHLRGADGRHIMTGGLNGLNGLCGIAMVSGIKYNRSFHSDFSLLIVGTNSILGMKTFYKYAE